MSIKTLTNPNRDWYFHQGSSVIKFMVPFVIEIFLYSITSKKRFTARALCYIQWNAIVKYLGFGVEYLESKIIVFNETVVNYAF